MNPLYDVVQASSQALRDVMPTLSERTYDLIHRLAAEGIYFGAFMGLRTLEQQEALYAQGRNSLAYVNALREKAGMSPIPEIENKHTVTTLKVSLHNFGLAVDLVEDGDPTRAGVQWSWKNNLAYLKIGKHAKLCGLEWGGFWKSFKDYPHVQLTGGYSVSEVIGMYRKGGLDLVYTTVENRLKEKNQ